MEGIRHARCASCGGDWQVDAGQWGPEMACPNCGMPVAPGSLVGHYQLLREVASGGLGSFAEAVDSVTGRVVGVKMLRSELFDRVDYVEELGREARVAASINHPNVAEVYDFFEQDGTHFLVMEYLDHGSLATRMKGGRLGEREVLRIALDVTRGLQAASSKGLLHRDVKPGNIVFDTHGRAKLVDFGLAMPAEEARRGSGSAWGSPYYIPPERLGGEPEDFRGDMYSLGATLFHAAAGRPPFKGDSASALATKHLKARKASVKAFAPHLSEETAWIINRCLERDPDARFESYFELIEALETAQRKAMMAPEVAPPHIEDVIGAERDMAWSLKWLTLTSVVLLLLGGGTWLALKMRAGRDVLVGAGAAPAAEKGKAGAAEPVAPDVASRLHVVRFTADEGYHEGDLGNHPDWQRLHGPSWSVAAGGGSLIFGKDLPPDGPGAVFKKGIRLEPGEMLQARIKFSFDGLGVSTWDQGRQIVMFRLKPAGGDDAKGLDVILIREPNRGDRYRLTAKYGIPKQDRMIGFADIKNFEVGDEKEDRGDPSDPLEIVIMARKGQVANGWSIRVVMRNLAKVKDLGKIEKGDVMVPDEFHGATEYFGSLRSRKEVERSSRVQVTEWVIGVVKE